MVKLENRSADRIVISKDEQGNEIKADYKWLASQCVGMTPGDKLTVEEMRKRYRILDAIEKADTEILLEDADFEKLKSMVIGFQWWFMSPNLIEFEDYIKELKPEK
jgi:hypothetical protein